MLVLRDGLLMRPRWLSAWVMQLLKKIQIPFPDQHWGQLLPRPWSGPCESLQACRREFQSTAVNCTSGRCPVSLCSEASGTFKAIKWHLAPSFQGQGQLHFNTGPFLCEHGKCVNTWMHDVSLSGMMSLGFSCARQGMDLRVVPAWVFTGEE